VAAVWRWGRGGGEERSRLATLKSISERHFHIDKARALHRRRPFADV
jgi:hypothetical protein